VADAPLALQAVFAALIEALQKSPELANTLAQLIQTA